MSRQFLNQTYIGAMLQQMSCKTMAKAMDAQFFIDTRSTQTILENRLCTVGLYAPPNGDNLNDRLGLITRDIAVIDFRIFNRYGQMVFYTTAPKGKWNRTFNGSKCDIGTYFYYAKIKCLKEQVREEKGDITLIR